MEKSAYLDAMNITRWRGADKPGKPYLVIHDLDADMSEHPFLNHILSLIGVTPELCDFDCQHVSGPQVVWDMRKVAMRPRVAWLVSKPLQDVIASPEQKRLLWKQICDHQNSQ
ncbi:DNA polymerase III subunit psi [Shewanella sp. WXL01]|uniref:DNA polymerase III subunit psi n=1 Tax=Shewanella sp. WXL01 TaxID=2709721 RepID=UPI0014383AF8|nr:DNA polymerase III subunit psi [Shewanella sp. WXL01]NKF49560.1 DNA polymerase III subunit psi [Shewanella sp. WXL01]